MSFYGILHQQGVAKLMDGGALMKGGHFFYELGQLLFLSVASQSCLVKYSRMVLLALGSRVDGIQWPFPSEECTSIVDGGGALNRGGHFFYQFGQLLLMSIASKHRVI